MFILHDLLLPLQAQFSNTAQGQRRKVWFVYTILAVIVPFTSSITSNLLRALQTLFGLKLKSQRFYAFMASPTLPMWGMIPSPAEEERIMVALDDSINPKTFSRSCRKVQPKSVSMVTVYSGSWIIEKNKIPMGLPAS